MIKNSNLPLQDYLKQKILPAVSFENSLQALPVAEAIGNGGLNVMEVPLRTEEAFLAIKRIRENMPSMYIGAGTILTVAQLHQAKESGAQFGLAPGFNPAIMKAAAEIDFPFIPGVMTPSEIELAIEHSCMILKLFPAQQAGGIKMLQALSGPYKHTGVQFIPMGGVSLQNMGDYLAQENVIAIGGSWIADNALIASENYEGITVNTAEALNVARSS
jgi:2-dehydro-3-deoxyphosphogluconate aldolase/(4S)-4-hydroxy-2-oxoglutarate aldolase